MNIANVNQINVDDLFKLTVKTAFYTSSYYIKILSISLDRIDFSWGHSKSNLNEKSSYNITFLKEWLHNKTVTLSPVNKNILPDNLFTIED